MRIAESERVIRTENGKTFRINDIITVEFIGTYTKPCTGRINFIDTLEFSVDLSERFKAFQREIKYEDVLSIKKAQSQEIYDPMRMDMVEFLAAIGVPVTVSETDMHRRRPEIIGRDVWAALDCLERGIRPTPCDTEPVNTQ